MKTEAMWIGSLQNCEDEPLGFKWKTCVKFLGIFITYDVELHVEKNFKERLKKIANLINLWRSRGLSIHGKVGVIKAILLPRRFNYLHKTHFLTVQSNTLLTLLVTYTKYNTQYHLLTVLKMLVTLLSVTTHFLHFSHPIFFLNLL